MEDEPQKDNGNVLVENRNVSKESICIIPVPMQKSRKYGRSLKARTV